MMLQARFVCTITQVLCTARYFAVVPGWCVCVCAPLSVTCTCTCILAGRCQLWGRLPDGQPASAWGNTCNPQPAAPVGAVDCNPLGRCRLLRPSFSGGPGGTPTCASFVWYSLLDLLSLRIQTQWHRCVGGGEGIGNPVAAHSRLLQGVRDLMCDEGHSRLQG